MPRDPEPWGGEVRLPRALRRLLRRQEPEDTSEKRAEARRSQAPERSVLENADKAAGGAFIVLDPPRTRRRLD